MRTRIGQKGSIASGAEAVADTARGVGETIDLAPSKRGHGIWPGAASAFIVVALGSLAFIVAALAILRGETIKAAERDAASLAFLIEEKVARTVQIVDLMLEEVGSDHGQRPSFDEESMHQLLRARVTRMPYLRAIWVLDDRGRMVYDSDTGNIGADLADRDYFIAHRNSADIALFIGNPVVSRSVSTWFVSLSRAVRRPDGELKYVVVAAFENRYFATLWRSVDVGTHGSIALVSRDGTLLIRNPPIEGLIGKSIPVAMNFRQYVSEAPAFTLRRTSSIDGVERIFSFAVVRDYPKLVIVLGRSVSEVLAPWRQFAMLALTGWLAAVAMLGALTLFLLRQIRARLLAETQVESLAKLALENPNPILRIGTDRAIQYANPPAAKLKAAVTSGASDGRTRWHAFIDKAMTVGPGTLVDAEFPGKSYAFTAAPVPQAGYVNLYATDITELKRAQRALEKSEDLFRQLAANIPEAFWVIEMGSEHILYASPGWRTITGWPPPTELRDVRAIVHPDDRERVAHSASHAGTAGLELDCRIVRPDGSVRWLHVQTFPVRNEAGEAYRMTGVAADVTEQKLAEERLLRMAHSDALTNLPNRRLFYDSLTRTLEHAREHHWIVGVLFVDLDRFKVVNDTLGHATGDELLRQVAERLTDCVRIRDLVGRLGGDEFGVLLLLDDPNEAGAAAEKILHTLVEPFTLEGREAFVSASIGITIYPTDATDPDTLLRYADTAMYRAKDDGRNVCRYYTAEMNARAAERLDLETDLRRALSQHEFLLDYQPKLDLATGAISGIEALLRWRRPGGVGLAPPADFMPLLEETGLIVPVGEWVIGEVCRQLRAWQHDGVQAVPIAVNLSARQFHDENLPDKVMQSVREHGVSSELLEFEITESSAMSSADQTAGILDVLRAAGARIAIDDFGTGYSSLTYLKRFPIDVIKIDGAFVRDVTTDADDAAIVLAIIGMAHQLGLRVVAEGVETVDQMSFLNAHGCDEIQGDVFSKPMDATKIAELLRGDPSTARWEAAGAR